MLADALAEADREEPALLIDLATLTGAARVALGPELPAIYSTPPELADQLRQVGEREADPMWPMPLWHGYDEDLGSRVADLNNVSTTQFAGSIIGRCSSSASSRARATGCTATCTHGIPRNARAGRSAPIRTPFARCTG